MTNAIQKYRKKPVVIEALLWSLDTPIELEWLDQAQVSCDGTNLFIETLEGTMRCDPGDYIIKGVAGEFYPCKPDIFHATYEEEEL